MQIGSCFCRKNSMKGNIRTLFVGTKSGMRIDSIVLQTIRFTYILLKVRDAAGLFPLFDCLQTDMPENGEIC